MTGNAVSFNTPSGSARRLVDVRNQRARQAVRHDPVLQGLQVKGRVITVIALVAAVVAAAGAGWWYLAGKKDPSR